MTGSGTPKFEIPTDMRKMTEQSVEQVKTAINAYLQLFRSNVPDNVMGGSALSDKALDMLSVTLRPRSSLPRDWPR